MIRWFVIYTDDGPNGPCGQCMSITCPWTKLFIFRSYESMKEFCENAGTGRKNPKMRVVDSVSCVETDGRVFTLPEWTDGVGVVVEEML